MAKRKRPAETEQEGEIEERQNQKQNTKHPRPAESPEEKGAASSNGRSCYIQIITGSYDQALHGIVAAVKKPEGGASERHGRTLTFNDNFLFKAHHSAIRCLAVSPIAAESSKKPRFSPRVFLATGGTDERVNIYQIEASAPKTEGFGKDSSEQQKPKNKEIGSLMHHASSINALHFASKSKLLSAAGDSVVAITRTRDWTMLSTVKAPVPQPAGRPSGDTAGPGEIPSGINDFSVHPSRKLMISVSKSERSMRLWNLMTGKKAGVLNFERALLQAVGEGRWSRGEGQKVCWNAAGDEFAIAFERGVAVFGMDSQPRAVIRPSPPSKVHQITYLPTQHETDTTLFAVSTEDGRVLFYSTKPNPVPGNPETEDTNQESLSSLPLLGQIGGSSTDSHSRVKDFVILADPSSDKARPSYLIVTGSSDGTVRVWSLALSELSPTEVETVLAENGTTTHKATNGKTSGKPDDSTKAQRQKQIGTLLATYPTSSRITCVAAFILLDATATATLAATSNGNGTYSEDEKSDGDSVPDDVADEDENEDENEDGDGESQDEFAGFD